MTETAKWCCDGKQASGEDQHNPECQYHHANYKSQSSVPMNKSEIAEFKFQPPPDSASREEIIGVLEYWVLRAKKAERAIAESQAWISVKEKLPEPNQTVFGRRDDDRVRVLEFCYDGVGGGENPPPDAGDWWWCEPYGDGEIDEFAYDLDTGDGPPNITHWMSLPKPPKGEKEERLAELGDGEPSPPPARSDKDYAIEHGGYLADAAEHYLKACNAFSAKECTSGCDTADRDLLSDHWRALENAIGEFRKRAKRAESGAAQEVSPTCPLCKKSNRFIRQPGTCSHPFHDEPFRKKVEEVSPPSPLCDCHKVFYESCPTYKMGLCITISSANTTTRIPCGSESSETGRMMLSGVQDHTDAAQIVGGGKSQAEGCTRELEAALEKAAEIAESHPLWTGTYIAKEIRKLID